MSTENIYFSGAVQPIQQKKKKSVFVHSADFVLQDYMGGTLST